MDFKDFRQNYWQDASLEVCRNAYGYSRRGHKPEISLSVAASLYAQKFIDNSLRFSGYHAVKELGRVCVYNLLTETTSAQRALHEGAWSYDDRNECIARLGENYRFKFKYLEFPDDLIVSVYRHNWRFVSVVALDGCSKASQVADFKRIGHVLAVNAVGYYERYLDDLELINQYKASDDSYFDKYLLKKPLEFDENYCFNPKSYSRQTDSIKAYLRRESGRIGTDIKLASVDVFGDFDCK